MDINFLVIRLLFSPFFNLLPFILSFVFVLVFKSFDSLLLCEGETLEELKELIKSDIVKHEELIKQAEDLEVKAKALSSLVVDNHTDWEAEKSWDEVSDKLDEAAGVYSDIFIKEAKIKESEPEYSCDLPKSKNHDHKIKHRMWD